MARMFSSPVFRMTLWVVLVMGLACRLWGDQQHERFLLDGMDHCAEVVECEPCMSHGCCGDVPVAPSHSHEDGDDHAHGDCPLGHHHHHHSSHAAGCCGGLFWMMRHDASVTLRAPGEVRVGLQWPQHTSDCRAVVALDKPPII
ncbi:hypothetical protein [Sulfuriroseicoccus oceanibius]|uniref:Uncharacterized protein n=1 Tax=Sulfuriroseicoccus oceanibius TaxID=2707525 RepID=A0A7T7F2V8_9BACT|nr:hypothetical protein [Sulfuriroseicoccus oceanibius]QQL45781.1 hypothetical protein G3M56_004130 [Sulfuriroseicoccus oceanibius]